MQSVVKDVALKDGANLRYLKGIGPKRASALEKLGITSAHELLYYFPRRYENRAELTLIKNLIPGQFSTIRGEVLAAGLRSRRFVRPQIFEAVIGDSSGQISAVWFNQAYLKSRFQQGEDVILYGKVDFHNKRFQINNPEFEFVEGEDPETIHAARITPVYGLTEGLYQKALRQTLHQIIESRLRLEIVDFLPEDFRKKHSLMDLSEAVGEMHFPSDFSTLEKARRRIVFDEFFIFEIKLLRKIAEMRARYRAYPIPCSPDLIEKFEKNLPFALTKCQSKVIREIGGDLKNPLPMNRLLMGDVGSGKTAVAAFGIYAAVQSGYQVAVLVPTEILAMQHARNLRELLKDLNVDIKLLTANTPTSARKKILAYLGKGKISVIVGTHALLQEDIRFLNLSLLIIDEQHKFGVYQRSRLLENNPRPHQLVMTATPIPRTLALTVFGDLEISSMKTLPKGRKPIKTYWIAREKQPKVLQHLSDKVKLGEQAYFIFPMIEETEKSDLLAAKTEFERLSTGIFKDVQMGLVHGKMRSEEREEIMKSFHEGKIQILVATSVIEVGVDNPNATSMVIENAERFGLSQLHQMRGRVGRGEKDSECFLFGEPTTDEGKKRLRILTKTQDGFVIAEEDLKLRGPGDFYGTRQSGQPLFKVAHPVFDETILLEARNAAKTLLMENQIDENVLWKPLKKHLDQLPIHY